jgi:hypothetical protein
MCFEYWRARLDLNQDNDGSRNCHGRCRMHHDAQRAVIGVGVERMYVRHLDHRQQRQQDQAHNGDNRPGVLSGAAIPA